MLVLLLVVCVFASSVEAAAPNFKDYVGVNIQKDKSMVSFGAKGDVKLYRRKASTLGLDGTLQAATVNVDKINVGNTELGKTLKDMKAKVDKLATKAQVDALAGKIDKLDAKLTKIWQYMTHTGPFSTTTRKPATTTKPPVYKHCGDVNKYKKPSGVYTIIPKSTAYKVYCNVRPENVCLESMLGLIV